MLENDMLTTEKENGVDIYLPIQYSLTPRKCIRELSQLQPK
jgi:hypothetical protein